MTGPASYAWMRDALERLCDEHDEAACVAAIRDAGARDRLKATIGVADGDLADNLFMGLLALRVKFPRDEALAKVDLNIAMRECRDGRTVGLA